MRPQKPAPESRMDNTLQNLIITGVASWKPHRIGARSTWETHAWHADCLKYFQHSRCSILQGKANENAGKPNNPGDTPVHMRSRGGRPKPRRSRDPPGPNLNRLGGVCLGSSLVDRTRTKLQETMNHELPLAYLRGVSQGNDTLVRRNGKPGRPPEPSA